MERRSLARLAQSPEACDPILLDTNSSPDFPVRTENTGLYPDTGLATVAKALTKGGLAIFWAATASPEFERPLSAYPWAWLREDIPLVPGRLGATHHIYNCSRDAALLRLHNAD